MSRNYLTILTLGLLLTATGMGAQEFESDEEIKDIRTRVTQVTHSVIHHNYASPSGIKNDTGVQFVISMQLWNPYDRALVSYGSSSCRWPSSLDPNFEEALEFENYGGPCTADYGSREFASGLSNETSLDEVRILGRTLETIPNGIIFVNGINGIFLNTSDVFYGAKMSISDGNITIEYESIPENWGAILFEASSISGLDLPYLAFFIYLVVLKLLTKRARRTN